MKFLENFASHFRESVLTDYFTYYIAIQFQIFEKSSANFFEKYLIFSQSLDIFENCGPPFSHNWHFRKHWTFFFANMILSKKYIGQFFFANVKFFEILVIVSHTWNIFENLKYFREPCKSTRTWSTFRKFLSFRELGLISKNWQIIENLGILRQEEVIEVKTFTVKSCNNLLHTQLLFRWKDPRINFIHLNFI